MNKPTNEEIIEAFEVIDRAINNNYYSTGIPFVAMERKLKLLLKHIYI